MDRCPNSLPVNEQSFRSIEVLSGSARRRRWSADEKAAIVAASLAPGVVARSIALRHGLHPNQLYAWRREIASRHVDGGAGACPSFVPVTVSAARWFALRAALTWAFSLPCCVR